MNNRRDGVGMGWRAVVLAVLSYCLLLYIPHEARDGRNGQAEDIGGCGGDPPYISRPARYITHTHTHPPKVSGQSPFPLPSPVITRSPEWVGLNWH